MSISPPLPKTMSFSTRKSLLFWAWAIAAGRPANAGTATSAPVAFTKLRLLIFFILSSPRGCDAAHSIPKRRISSADLQLSSFVFFLFRLSVVAYAQRNDLLQQLRIAETAVGCGVREVFVQGDLGIRIRFQQIKDSVVRKPVVETGVAAQTQMPVNTL